MCGIVGLVRPGMPVPNDVIARAAATLSHRGPDQSGVWQSGDAALGATRLKVIDPNAGSQPMHLGGLTLVFNGEIYNHRQLREELVSHGHAFGTTCDTEVVLHAFAHWGTASFARLRGMFAVAIWSAAEQELTLARDPGGIKPLFYLEDGPRLYFGSEMKAIFVHPEVRRCVDRQSLDTYLSMNYVPGRRTMAAGICKLQPGHVLTWKHGKTFIQPYGEPLQQTQVRRRDLAESAEELDGLLHASVGEQLVADVPVGIWLSGGLDSSTLVHYASQHSTQRLRTFSITFQGRSFDESSDSRAIASAYGTDHHEFDLGPEQVTPDSILDLVYYADDPIADAGAVPAWHLSRMCAREVTVALSGEGSDELFGGYLTYAADRYAQWARMVPATARSMALSLANRLQPTDEKIGFEYKLQRFLAGSLLPPAEAHIFWNGTHSAEQRQDLLLVPQSEYSRHILSSLPKGRGLQRFLQFDQRYYLADDILTKVDRMSMAHSLEVRPAFLDPRIVAFASGLPMDHCIGGGTTKRVLRHLMRDKLPSRILAKGKQGLDIPVHEWLRGHLRPLLLDTLSQHAVEASGLFRWSTVSRMIDTHMKREANLGYHLWGMLMLFLWIRQWNVECHTDSQAYTPEFAATE